MNKSYQLSAMLVGAALTLVQPQAVWALEPTEVNEIAKQITVRISGGGSNGTGVIIAKKRNSYYVLTAHHVVRRPNVYQIKTLDGREYRVDYSTVRRLPGIDLALLEFTSSRTKYEVAEIGDSERLTEGSAVYIAGWPAPGATIQERVYQFTEGKISGRRNSSVEGYTLIYTNVTRKGMSGGPVLNDRGQVIAIHGKAEGDSLSSGTGGPVLMKAGFNLGIPIQTFIDSSYGSGLRIGKRNQNYRISEGGNRTPTPAISQGAVRNRRPPSYTSRNDNRFPSHIVLRDPSQPFVGNDIERIDSLLADNGLRPAACSRNSRAEFNVGSYKVCAYPTNEYPPGSYGLSLSQQGDRTSGPTIGQPDNYSERPAIGQGGYPTSRTATSYSQRTDNRFPPHIVLEDRTLAVVTDDIDRINLVLDHKNLQPANCNETDFLVHLTMGPYKVCAYPTNEYVPAESYEFPFSPKVASSETPPIHPPIPDNGTGTGRIVIGTKPSTSESYSLPEHIVLTDPSGQVGSNDIDRINFVLDNKNLQPAACNHDFPVVRIKMGPYQVCAYPTNEYLADDYYEFNLIQ